MIGKMVVIKNQRDNLAHLQPMIDDDTPAARVTFCGLKPAENQAAALAELAAAAGVEVAALDLETCPACAARQDQSNVLGGP